MPFTSYFLQASRIDSKFSSVSFIKGNIGQSQTTVGISRFCISARIFNRWLVGHTFSSIFLQRLSSKVVKVICTTVFAFWLILSKISISRKIKSLFVWIAIPNPYFSIN